MRSLAKSLVLSAAVAATTLVPVLEASAGERWREHRPRHPEKHTYYGRDQQKSDLLAAGILGLAAGALVVGLANASQPPAPRYYDYDPYDYDVDVDYYPPAPRTYARPVVTYAQPRAVHQPKTVYRRVSVGAEPWTPEWYRYCSERYRSFDARTGTFRGYDGQDHFCVAN